MCTADGSSTQAITSTKPLPRLAGLVKFRIKLANQAFPNELPSPPIIAQLWYSIRINNYSSAEGFDNFSNQ